MAHEEIEAELVEVARDLEHITRRANIAAANLKAVKNAKTSSDTLALRIADRSIVAVYINHLANIEGEAETTRSGIENLASMLRADWAKKGGAE